MQYSLSKKRVKPLDSDALLIDNTKQEQTGRRLIDLAWVGGLLDGEGCFSFYTSCPRISAESTWRTVIEEVHRILGGKCYVVKRKTNLNRQVFRWSIVGKEALKLCPLVIPYLRDKREQAELLSTVYDYPSGSAKRESIAKRLAALKKVSL